MNEIEKQEFKELIREVVREELAKLNYGFIPDAKPIHTMYIQSVPVYGCPVIEERING